MNKMICRQYKPSDAYSIKLRDIEFEDYEGINFQHLAFNVWGKSQISCTIESNGVVVACGGVYIQGTEGLAWILSSDDLDSCKLFFYKTVKGWLERAFDFYGCVRVQTLVNVSNYRSMKFVESLGMKREGTLHRHGPNGLDRHIYARWTE